MNALGGMNATIDPMVNKAAKTIGLTLFDIIADPEFRTSTRKEFEERTGGGIGGTKWEAPWCDYDPPLEHPWPRYHQTKRGFEWWIPETAADRALHRG
jgi:aminobenzoyl-glutamate utilization protein B